MSNNLIGRPFVLVVKRLLFRIAFLQFQGSLTNVQVGLVPFEFIEYVKQNFVFAKNVSTPTIVTATMLTGDTKHKVIS